MRAMDKKSIINVGLITVFVASLLAFILNILFKIKSDSIFSAEWQAGDALGYVASVFGAVGTIILGYVAYKQNGKLQELESNNYIANYSALVLMNEVHIKGKANVPVNWSEHSEQIIVDADVKSESGYVGYDFTFVATGVGNATPALLHIKECNVFCSDDERKNMSSYLFGKNYADVYSRVAIHKDNKIKFGMTYIVDKNKKDAFEKAIKQNAYNVIVEVVFYIVTDKNVITKCKCRSYCDGQNQNDNIRWEDKDPMVFFYGHDIADVRSMKISGEE